MAQQRAVVEDLRAAEVHGVHPLEVGVAPAVVPPVVHRGVVDAAAQGDVGGDLVHARGDAPLVRPPLEVVGVVPGQVDPVRPPQVLVGVVVANDVEALAAAAALRHAPVEEVAQGSIRVIPDLSFYIRIVLEIVVRIKNGAVIT